MHLSMTRVPVFSTSAFARRLEPSFADVGDAGHVEAGGLGGVSPSIYDRRIVSCGCRGTKYEAHSLETDRPASR